MCAILVKSSAKATIPPVERGYARGCEVALQPAALFPAAGAAANFKNMLAICVIKCIIEVGNLRLQE